ncbi:hypothetical protein WJX72_003781 [[Myrmecia] bisecta]|uniref:Apple domain-containing protein n=1 Tax=[Myrmecia] bisecta TaxID=41462 RepID=A0AAW1QQ10_9CHLO
MAGNRRWILPLVAGFTLLITLARLQDLANLLAGAHPESLELSSTRDRFLSDPKPLAATSSVPKPGAQASSQSGAAGQSAAGQCRMMPNTDYWGDPVKWGPQNKLDSAAQCCQACAAYKPPTEDDVSCNIWVYCGDKQQCGDAYRECWLKHMAHPGASRPRTGPEVPWTSGVMTSPTAVLKADTGPQETSDERRYHTVITAQGTAVHWQARVHYYWFLKIKAQCEAAGSCQMGGFTRILHSGEADELMDEIPTFVADPLPDEGSNGGYVVLNRPYAFVQWVAKAKIPEKYVLMSEPDHVWLKPMPNLMIGRQPAAFPFFYIEPSKPEFIKITEKFTGKLRRKQAESIAPIGNAPTLMAFDDLQRVAPGWLNVSLAIFHDEEAHKAWGWVQEMYGFTISCYNAGIAPIDLHLDMMSQPPWDTTLEPFYLLHYTYGMDYTLQGEFTPGKYGDWRFDKRSYSGSPPPRNLGQPPTGMKNELVRHLINAINEATAHIPGWNEYAETGRATQLWDGRL